MTLQSSGAISLSQIAAEFGGSAPHSLSEYYEGHSGIPSSGTISMSQFYGTSAPSYVYATGGSVNNSGVWRRHYFYSSGYLNVTNAGNAAGSNSVYALIIAGGGGGESYASWRYEDQDLDQSFRYGDDDDGGGDGSLSSNECL